MTKNINKIKKNKGYIGKINKADWLTTVEEQPFEIKTQ